MKTTAPPQFEFVGTIDELVKYVTEVFHDGPRLVVHASVILPMPRPRGPATSTAPCICWRSSR